MEKLNREKLCITMDEACRLASVGREQLERWAMDTDFPSMRVGKEKARGKRLIHLDAFNEWLRKRCEMRVGE